MHQVDYFREQAAKFRKLAEDCDFETKESLLAVAEGYETEADRLEQELQFEKPTQSIPRME
jgi:hypothetical protein